MPKLKTHKGAAKRIKVTGSGKLLHRRASRSHHRGRKLARQRMGRGEERGVPETNPRIEELIPYK